MDKKNNKSEIEHEIKKFIRFTNGIHKGRILNPKWIDKIKLDSFNLGLLKAKEIIEEFGQYPCGFIDSSDNLCDKIDKEELIKKINGEIQC